MTTVTLDRLLLFDTASLYFRAYYGMPDSLRAADGRPTNAVRGLVEFLARFVTEYSPSHVAACWDVDWRPGWRVAAVPTYKTHRLADPREAELAPRALTPTAIERITSWDETDEEVPDGLEAQVPLILATLAAAGIPVVGADHYEADDVIATLARTTPCAVDVVTGDRDLFQLVDDAHPIRVLYTAGKGGIANHVVVDAAVVAERYGVAPPQYADFALLRGDASDGLPGVAGIGEKSAASLIARFGDLEGILAAASDPSSDITPGLRRKLAAGIEYMAAARDVVRVADGVENRVPLDELRLRPVPDPDTFDALAEALNLGGAAQRLAAALAGTAQ